MDKLIKKFEDKKNILRDIFISDRKKYMNSVNKNIYPDALFDYINGRIKMLKIILKDVKLKLYTLKDYRNERDKLLAKLNKLNKGFFKNVEIKDTKNKMQIYNSKIRDLENSLIEKYEELELLELNYKKYLILFKNKDVKKKVKEKKKSKLKGENKKVCY